MESGFRDSEDESGTTTTWYTAIGGAIQFDFAAVSVNWREEDTRSDSTGDIRSRSVYVSLDRRLK